MDDILSSEDELLTSGYAGTQVISVKLDTLGDARRKRQTEPELGTAQNDTATKECKVIVTIHVQFDGIGEMLRFMLTSIHCGLINLFLNLQKVDSIVIETEIVFAGPAVEDVDVKTKIDNKVEDNRADYNITHVAGARGKL